jgi:hypothetical protein
VFWSDDLAVFTVAEDFAGEPEGVADGADDAADVGEFGMPVVVGVLVGFAAVGEGSLGITSCFLPLSMDFIS